MKTQNFIQFSKEEIIVAFNQIEDFCSLGKTTLI